MSKLQDIQDFMETLKFSAGVPNNTITKSDIYNELSYYNIPKNLRGQHLESMIDNNTGKLLTPQVKEVQEALTAYNNTFTISVDDSERRFYGTGHSSNDTLTFSTYERENPIGHPDPKPYGQLFIPFQLNRIALSAELIKFLIGNNINVSGKLSNIVSNNMLELTVYSQEDAQKISDFIQINMKQSDFQKTNPFMPQHGYIGAMGHPNYIDDISNLLAQFIEQVQTYGSTNDISIDNFLIALENSIATAHNKEGLQQIINTLSHLIATENVIPEEMDNL